MSTVIETTQQATLVEPPPMYHVMLKNDDYTPFEFVIMLLMDVFFHSGAKAEAIAQEVHERGQASAGIFSRDIAESKVDKVHKAAAREKHPLRAYIEQV